MKITEQLLANPGKKGKHLVVALKEDHRQPGCELVPAGTRGIATILHGGDKICWFVFPHSILPDAKRVYIDGHLRKVEWTKLEPLGRVG